MLSEGFRAFSEVHDRVKNFSADHTNEFGLVHRRQLVMQYSQDAFGRNAMIVLDKFGRNAVFGEELAVIALEESPAVVFGDAGLDDNDLSKLSLKKLHRRGSLGAYF